MQKVLNHLFFQELNSSLVDSPRFADFQEMGGVGLKDLKAHTNAVGGAWGDDTWAALVRASCDAVIEDPEDEANGLEDTKAKRALLIPINVFTSSHIIRIAALTGQSEDYKKFGVDEETPSGVLDIRNSTQASGSTLNLVSVSVGADSAPTETETSVSIFPHLLCGKVLKSDANLKKHVEKVHHKLGLDL